MVREEELKEQAPLCPDPTSKIFREIPMWMIRTAGLLLGSRVGLWLGVQGSRQGPA